MKHVALDADLTRKVVVALGKSPLFRDLSAEDITKVVAHAKLVQFEAAERVMSEGDPPDALYVLLRGEVSVRVASEGSALDGTEVSRLAPPEAVGEMGVLLGEKRSASVLADGGPVIAIRFEVSSVLAMFQRIPGFGLAMSRALASRLAKASQKVPVPEEDQATVDVDHKVLPLLPVDLLQRYRMLPLRADGNRLTVGFVDDPSPHAIAAIRQHLPSMQTFAVRIPAKQFERILSTHAGDAELSKSGTSVAAPSVKPASPRLDALLHRMVAEGASDLHLSPGLRPRWRIDGEMHELAQAQPLAEEEVLDLLRPVMHARNREQFSSDNDTDFAYAVVGLARFRTNVFRDRRGVGAVMRQIPDKILTVEQLGLPAAVQQFCELPKGLVLVTGPTGSGKSTTLAAMVDGINRTRRTHVITLEDPIEFVHESQAALINQREVGPHTNSFARALRAALREDPDIVLVGEMRDLETVSLALETANTGHLVFGTLHTATATSTVDRIINMFVPEQQAQIRATLADVLKGVVAQTLCKKLGGGRVAALEILVGNFAVANLIREGKTFQIASVMSTGRKIGNQLLNDELQRLVATGKVAPDEAMLKAIDKADLAKKLEALATNTQARMA